MKKTEKRVLSLILSVLLLLSLGATALAEKVRFADVSENAWYAEAVQAVREANLMNGVGDNRFEPDGVFTRAQLATVLYNMAGNPEVHGEDAFTDTVSGQWYSDAVLWASQNGIVSGYGDGRFGTTDATTQEQMAVMLWRNAGSYVLGAEYADENGVEKEASSWAVEAVRWARVDGLLTEKIAFTPKAAATRAQVADMIYRYLQLLEKFRDVDAVSGATAKADADKKVLVAYFSCTGATEKIAGYIAEAADATLYQITPETPYTADDLNYNNNSSRTTQEQNDASARPAIKGAVENMADYDVIFLGYPIWWGQAPKIMYSFVESYNLSGKTIIPFCTSGASPVGSSAENLHPLAPDAVWKDGTRFARGTTKEKINEWLKQFDLKGKVNVKDDVEPVRQTCVLVIEVNGKNFYANFEDNSSAEALKEKLNSEAITVDMHDYGRFEKVGSLPWDLPRNDTQITTEPGDVILYQGNQITVYYDTNSWNLTRLAHIGNTTKNELLNALGDGDVSVKFSLEWGE